MNEPTENTKVMMLLCSNWGKDAETVKPLSPGEFNDIAAWLDSEGLEFADLIGKNDVLELYHRKPVSGIEPSGLETLLKNGAGMALRTEQWLNNGLWVLGIRDPEYPERLKTNLKKYAPPIIYGCGSIRLLSSGGIAVVGSRDIDDQRVSFTATLCSSAGQNGITVVSGCARGADQVAMHSALEACGSVVGVLAGDLARAAIKGFMRESIESGKSALVSPYKPDAGFSVGNAMGRNKHIYALSDAVVVISASYGKGGTWAGASENLEKWHIPLYVFDQSDLPGNIQLIKRGAMVLPMEALHNPAILFANPPRHSGDGLPLNNMSDNNPGDSSEQLSLFTPKSEE